MKEIREKARAMFKGSCRVCPLCDGRVCASEVPGMGGLGTGASFRANLSALAELKFKMRVIHEATAPDLSLNLLGLPLSLPVLAAPIAGVKLNMKAEISEAEYISAVILGCHAAGALGSFGDGVIDEFFESGLAALKAANGAAIPFVKPWSDELLRAKIASAAEAGAKIIGMDIDAIGLITLAKLGRPVSPRNLTQLRRIIEDSGLKFILKGIMTPEDALLAAEAGAEAIVVSNHGGRVLDHAPGTAQVLPDIARAMRSKLTILVDGGVRGGVDVLKMLALGADAVMIGRPFSIASVGGGQAGVQTYIEKIRAELTSAMILTGCPSLASVNENILY